ENLYVRNVEVGEVKEAVLHIDLEYMGERGQFPPTVHNLLIENVTSHKSNMPLYLVGIEGHAIENVVIRNCEFQGAKQASVFEHVGSIFLENVTQPRVKD